MGGNHVQFTSCVLSVSGFSFSFTVSPKRLTTTIPKCMENYAKSLENSSQDPPKSLLGTPWSDPFSSISSAAQRRRALLAWRRWNPPKSIPKRPPKAPQMTPNVVPNGAKMVPKTYQKSSKKTISIWHPFFHPKVSTSEPKW